MTSTQPLFLHKPVLARIAGMMKILLLVALADASGAQGFIFGLDGRQVVPPTASDHQARCVGILDVGNELKLNCVDDLTATAVRLRRSRAGDNGPVLFDFAVPDDNIVRGSWQLTSQQTADLWNGNLYVEMASAQFPNGELRGQISGIQLPLNLEYLSFTLDSDQVVLPSRSEAEGSCLGAIDQADNELLLVCSHNVEEPIAFHIHRGERGERGPVLYEFGTGESPIFVELLDLPDEFFDDLRAGRIYVNVHSQRYQDGDIRGQFVGCFSDPQTLCLNRGRFKVEVEYRDFEGNSGRARAVPETRDSGMFWFFGPDNLEVLVKALDGCAFNDHFWVFVASTTNVEFTLEVTDTLSGEVSVYRNPLGQQAETVLDTAAFATCDQLPAR